MEGNSTGGNQILFVLPEQVRAKLSVINVEDVRTKITNVFSRIDMFNASWYDKKNHGNFTRAVEKYKKEMILFIDTIELLKSGIESDMLSYESFEENTKKWVE